MSERTDDFEDLFEHAPCGYIVMGPDGRICRVNRTLCEWLGRTPDDLEGKHPNELLNIAGRIFYETHIAPLLRMQGFFHEVALDLISEGGETVPVIANAVEHRDAEGGAEFTRIAFLKAADRRRYEHELLRARDAAQDALRSERKYAELREQFLAVLSHDLRNPLAALSSGIRLLDGKVETEDERRELLKLMGNAAQRMGSLIGDLMDLARTRLGHVGLPISPSAVPLQPVLEQVCDELKASHPARIINCDFRLPGTVLCDPARIGQLLSNLLGNALAHGSKDHPINVRARIDGATFELSVSNAGDPIPEDTMPRLFEPFARGPQPHHKGLGLGLYIVSEIAKAHGGTLRVSSTPKETRFTFQMPLSTEAS